jgi:hypothetical protein
MKSPDRRNFVREVLEKQKRSSIEREKFRKGNGEEFSPLPLGRGRLEWGRVKYRRVKYRRVKYPDSPLPGPALL